LEILQAANPNGGIPKGKLLLSANLNDRSAQRYLKILQKRGLIQPFMIAAGPGRFLPIWQTTEKGRRFCHRYNILMTMLQPDDEHE